MSLDPHPYQPDLDPQMAGDCATCGNRRLHSIHDIDPLTLGDLRELIRTSFSSLPHFDLTIRIAEVLHGMTRASSEIIPMSKLMSRFNVSATEEYAAYILAIAPLCSSRFSIVNMICIDADGKKIPSDVADHMIRTGEGSDKAYIALEPRPLLLQMAA